MNILNIYRNGIVAGAIASVFILSSTIAVADVNLVKNGGLKVRQSLMVPGRYILLFQAGLLNLAAIVWAVALKFK